MINSFFNLVSEKDFEKITVADITKGAQVNRATFYPHFNDKYELLDYIIGDSALTAIEKRTLGVAKFDQDSINQLVLAVCDFYQQPIIQCRRSYLGLVLPQLKEQILNELKLFLLKSLEKIYTDMEMNFYVPIYANIIHEAGYLWASGKVSFDKEEIAKKVSSLVTEGYDFPRGSSDDDFLSEANQENAFANGTR